MHYKPNTPKDNNIMLHFLLRFKSRGALNAKTLQKISNWPQTRQQISDSNE